jgi:hypothetical protein
MTASAHWLSNKWDRRYSTGRGIAVVVKVSGGGAIRNPALDQPLGWSFPLASHWYLGEQDRAGN